MFAQVKLLLLSFSLCYKGVVGEMVNNGNLLFTAIYEIALEHTYPIQ
jgi:hypothetical protein